MGESPEHRACRQRADNELVPAFRASDFTNIPTDVWHFVTVVTHPTDWRFDAAMDLYRCSRTWANGDHCDTIHDPATEPRGGQCRRVATQPLDDTPVGSPVDREKIEP